MAEELRYERKFYLSDVSLSDVLKSVKTNTAGFSEIFHIRQINNIYFDTPGFESYYDNVDGSYNRMKARIRWYGDTFGKAHRPTLEFKIKKGLLGYKKNYVLPDFQIDETVTKDKLNNILLSVVSEEELKNYIKMLHPVLLNVYTRQYFSSMDNAVRLTVDMGMHYYKMMGMQNLFISKIQDNSGIVIEMKYAIENEEKVNEISAQLPFLMTKNSKYLQGLNRIGLI
ncbi:MAG: VTC domain-containing protein [Bacteroidia bacterium]|nr:VTC domain-containing protein [Bacteroidia bacterium]